MRKIYLLAALAVSSAMVFGGNIRFEKITDASVLQDKDSVIMVYETGKVANGNKNSTGKYFASVEMAINSAGEVEIDEETAKTSYIKLIKSGSNWKMMRGSQYVRTKSVGTLDFDASATGTSYTYTWTITINSGNAVIASTTSTYGEFRCNIDATPIFRTYTSGYGEDIQLYRRIANQATSVTGVTLSKNELKMRLGDDAVALTATVAPSNATNKNVTWEAKHGNASVTNAGAVSAVSVGLDTIVVHTEDGNKTDTCFVTILPAIVPGEATWKAVQKAEYLEGAKVFFASADANFIMTRYESGNNIKGIAATFGDQRHTVTGALQYAYTVEKDGDYYLFKDQDGKYLRTISSSKLGSGDKDDYAKWTVGAFDEDDATVAITNAKNTSCVIYNNYNDNSNNLFNVYSGTGTKRCLVVLYSDKAQDWVEREKHPSLSVDVTSLDWGEVEMDETTHDWGGPSKKIVVTLADLDADVTLTLDGDPEFYLSMGSDVISKDKTSFTTYAYWEASTAGTYSATLTLHTETAGVDDIVIPLSAVAVDQTQDPSKQPQFSASVDHMYLNPNYSGNSYYDLQEFTFSASNLAKTLYCHWAHTSSVLFDYEYQNQFMTILAGSDYVQLNKTVEFAADQDYTDEEVLIELDGLAYVENSMYTTYLEFYSLKADSKTERAIDVKIPIYIKITDDPAPDPATGMESVQQSEIKTQKVLREGRMVIIRNSEEYTITGERL